jgi:putative membrane protein
VKEEITMQNRSMLMAACGTAALLVSAVAQASSLSRNDREFMNSVATMDMTGAHAGEMAQARAKNAEVKDFAKMLAKDDSESFGHLAELAAKTGVTIPRGINAARIPALQGLTNLNGAQFDRQFTKGQIAAGQHALAVFKHEAKYGQNDDLKSYANRMIPIADNDLKRAQQIWSDANKSK